MTVPSLVTLKEWYAFPPSNVETRIPRLTQKRGYSENTEFCDIHRGPRREKLSILMGH